MTKMTMLASFVLFFVFQSYSFAEMKTFIKEYTYQASEVDSKVSSRVTATREVKRLLLEELGTYLESVTEVKNFQLTKDQITSLTAGIVKTEIIAEKWNGETYWIKTKIVADGNDVIKSIAEFRRSRDLSQNLENTKKRADAILEENKKLRKELERAKGNTKQKVQQKYDNSINELSAIQWFESGVNNYKNRNIEQAINDLSKAIELNPNYDLAYAVRGMYNRSLRKNDDAFSDLSKAIELNHNDSRYYNYRASVNVDLRKYDDAFSDNSKSIELNPNYDQAYASRAFLYERQGQRNKAINDYSKAIELGTNIGNTANNYYYRARLYSMLGDKDNAIQDLNKAIQGKRGYLNSAKTDAAFNNMRNNYDFKRLIGE